MKKLLVGLFGLTLLFATTANAGMNIRQNGDGSTDWQDASGNNFNVGAAYLTVNLSNVSSTSLSSAVAVPTANSHVTSIRAVLHGVVTGNAVLNFYAGTALTAGSISTSNEISNGTSPITLTGSGSGAGTIATLTPSLQHAVTAGDVILITTDGGSTNAVSATITITVEPDGD